MVIPSCHDTRRCGSGLEDSVDIVGKVRRQSRVSKGKMMPSIRRGSSHGNTGASAEIERENASSKLVMVRSIAVISPPPREALSSIGAWTWCPQDPINGDREDCLQLSDGFKPRQVRANDASAPSIRTAVAERS